MTVVLILLPLGFAALAPAQEDKPPRYEVDAAWPKRLPKNWLIPPPANPTAIYSQQPPNENSPTFNRPVLSLVKILSFLNAFGISNIHESEFKARSCG